MPRPPKRSGASTWAARPYKLGPRTRKILAQLNLANSRAHIHALRAERVLNKVELLLGAYPGAVKTITNSPRQSIPLGRPGREAFLWLVGELRRVYWSVRSDVEENFMAAAAEDEARSATERLYPGGARLQSPAHATEARFVVLSRPEADEAKFVTAALEAARPKIHFSHPVRRYFVQPGGALPHDREKVLARLFRKVRAFRKDRNR